MNLKELKLYMLRGRIQVVLFHVDGILLDSCDGLSELSKLKGKSLYEFSPLLYSMKDQVRKLKAQEAAIHIPAVEYDFPDREGVFDFDFKAHPQEKDQRLWFIHDLTDYYHRMQRIQQERNMLLVEKQQRR